LCETVKVIMSEVSGLDEEQRKRSTSYQQLLAAVRSQNRAKTGNLLVRDLTEVIQQQPDCYIETENLTTLYVVVPKHKAREWQECYETLVEDYYIGGGVVPRSSRLLATDNEYHLYTVVIFRIIVPDFKQEACLRKFTVRDWSADPDPMLSVEVRLQQMQERLHKKKEKLSRWCNMAFAVAFIAWVHLKAIQTFVESILRYSFPADFVPILIGVSPAKRDERRLRQALNQLYKDCGPDFSCCTDSYEEIGILGNNRFYSYASTEIAVPVLRG